MTYQPFFFNSIISGLQSGFKTRRYEQGPVQFFD